MHIDREATMPGDRAPEGGFTGDVRISGYLRRAAPAAPVRC